jgi:hypothetical protein
MESETETEKRISEYWARAYNNKNKNKNNKFSICEIGSADFKNGDDNQLPYEPTAVLAKAPPPTKKRFSIKFCHLYDLT